MSQEQWYHIDPRDFDLDDIDFGESTERQTVREWGDHHFIKRLLQTPVFIDSIDDAAGFTQGTGRESGFFSYLKADQTIIGSDVIKGDLDSVCALDRYGSKDTIITHQDVPYTYFSDMDPDVAMVAQLHYHPPEQNSLLPSIDDLYTYCTEEVVQNPSIFFIANVNKAGQVTLLGICKPTYPIIPDDLKHLELIYDQTRSLEHLDPVDAMRQIDLRAFVVEYKRDKSTKPRRLYADPLSINAIPQDIRFPIDRYTT